MKHQKVLMILCGIVLLIILIYIGVKQYTVTCKQDCTNKSIQMVEELREKMYEKVTPEQAKQKMEQENGIFLLDVRTQEEYEQGHIKNSVLVPLSILEEKIDQILKDKEQTILVYCRSGVRSKQATMILIQKGYNKVLDMGGIMDWKYEIER